MSVIDTLAYFLTDLEAVRCLLPSPGNVLEELTTPPLVLLQSPTWQYRQHHSAQHVYNIPFKRIHLDAQVFYFFYIFNIGIMA